MAYKVLEGKFKAKVLPFTFEMVGENNLPMMKAHVAPVGAYVGDTVQLEEGLPKQNYGYFLSLDIVEKGKYAGKSKLEAVRIELEETFGYKGPLDEETINAHVNSSDRFVDIVCEANGKFTRIKYINPVGGGAGKAKKPIKQLDAAALAAFNKHWGAGKTEAPKDASSLFAQLTGGKT